jgi:hypothetical protein
MIRNIKSVAVSALCFLTIAAASATDYGNANDIAAVRNAVQSQTIRGRGYTCTVHANKIVVIGSYAYVEVFDRDPCGAGAEDLWAKRNGSWLRVLLGHPMVLPCTMSSIGVPRDVITQLLWRFKGTTAARVQQDLKDHCSRY